MIVIFPGLIKFLTPLHDANRGERVTTDVLYKRWVTFWDCNDFEVGSPLVTDNEYEPDVAISWIWRPLCQPLHDIREYFGENISLFFAWLGFYTYYLLLPVAFLIPIYISMSFYQPGPTEVDYRQVVTVFLVVTWVVLYIEGWRDQSQAISLKWGTHGFESVQKDRPQFKGEEKPDGTLHRSYVDNKVILFLNWHDQCVLPYEIVYVCCAHCVCCLLILPSYKYIYIYVYVCVCVRV